MCGCVKEFWEGYLEHDHEVSIEKLHKNKEYNNAKSKCMDDGGKSRYLFMCLEDKEKRNVEQPSD